MHVLPLAHTVAAARLHLNDWMPPGWRRFHVPLISDPDITMRADRIYEVMNNADVERVHIQINRIVA